MQQNQSVRVLAVFLVVFLNRSGAACGVFVGCLFNDIAVAITVMPVFLLPVMVLAVSL